MSKPRITVNNTERFSFDVDIENETTRLGYHGGIFTRGNSKYFLETPYHGRTDTQQLYKLVPIDCEVEEILG